MVKLERKTFYFGPNLPNQLKPDKPVLAISFRWLVGAPDMLSQDIEIFLTEVNLLVPGPAAKEGGFGTLFWCFPEIVLFMCLGRSSPNWPLCG